MNLRRRKGYWYVDFRSDGRRFQKSLKTRDKTKAELRAAALRVQFFDKQGEHIPADERRTAVEFVEDILARAEREYWWNANTFRSAYRPRLMAFANQFASIRLSKLSGTQVYAWICGLDFSDSTKRHYLTVLNSVFRKAKKLGITGANPLDEYSAGDLPRPDKPQVEILSSDETRTLLKTAMGHVLEPIVMIARYTGMRFEEILQADWGDVDWERRVLRVRRKPERRWKPKGKQEREIPLTLFPEFYKWLAALHRKTRPQPSDAICKNLKGERYRSQPQHAVERLYRRAGLEPKGLHVLRHTWATELLRRGEQPYNVSRWLGHSSFSVTEENYIHFFEPSRLS